MNKYIYTALVAATSSILTLMLGGLAVLVYIVQPFQKEAVDRGFADWAVTNNATGSTKFTWNEFATAVHPANPAAMFDQIEQPIEEINKKKK